MPSDAPSDTAAARRFDAPEPTGGPRAALAGRRRRWTIMVSCAVVLVLVVAGVVIWRVLAAQAQARANARADDAAKAEILVAGRQEITEMTQVDYRATDAVLNRWLSVSAGTLHSTLSTAGPALMRQLQVTRFASSGRIVSALVTSVNRADGTATMSASVDVALSYNGSASATRHDEIQVTMSRTPAGWKLTSMAGATLVGG